MKKYLFLAICTCLSFVGCTDTDEFSTAKQHKITLRASVEESNDTRANFVKETGKFFWTNGDRISVYTTNDKFDWIPIQEGQGTGNATFGGSISGEITKCAIYPDYDYGSNITGNTLSLNVSQNINYSYTNPDYPTEQTAEFNSAQMPMLAKITENGQENLSFKHLGGAIAIKLTDIPANISRLDFISKKTKIAGTFTVDLSETTPTIKAEEADYDSEQVKHITITPSSSPSTQTFYIPLPCGDIEGFDIRLCYEDGTYDHIIDYNKTINISRATIHYFSELNYASIDKKQLLIDFYKATGGDNWHINTNWCSDKPLNEWYGVTAYSWSNEIIRIDLSNNNLSGDIPESIGGLFDLQELILNNNKLTSIPNSIYNLSRLEHLSLMSNNITTVNSNVSKLSNLKMLQLSSNPISASFPSFITSMTNLEDLELVGCELTGTIPSEIGNMKNLKTLSLSGNRLSGSLPADICNLTKLERLDLCYNSLSGEIPSNIGNLINLKVLILNDNYFSGSIPVSMGNLENLEYLYLNNNNLSGDIPVELLALTKFKYLDISNNDFNPLPSESIDFETHEGEVVTLQTATANGCQAIDLVFLGTGFIDKDMDTNGKFETKMRWGMESFFSHEPLKSFRNRFNVYAVKAISANSKFFNNAKLAFYGDDNRTPEEYAKKAVGASASDVYVTIIAAPDYSVQGSFCRQNPEEKSFCAFIFEPSTETLVHEACGHGFGKLLDEYVQTNETLPEGDKNYLDAIWTNYGAGANVDWHGSSSDVKWKHFLNNNLYSNEVGIFEGAYNFKTGVYRPTEQSIMNIHTYPGVSFNAPSREAIYKAIRERTEPGYVYKFEDFVEYDAINRTTPSAAPKRKNYVETSSADIEQWKKQHKAPVIINKIWREVVGTTAK